MSNASLVLGAVAFLVAVGIDYTQARTGQKYLSRDALFLVFAASVVLTLLSVLIWMFTADLPRGVSIILGLVMIAVLGMVMLRMRAGLPSLVRGEETAPAEDGDEPRGGEEAPAAETSEDPPPAPRRTRRAAAVEPEDGWDESFHKRDRAYIVGDDPVPTEKTTPRDRD